MNLRCSLLYLFTALTFLSCSKTNPTSSNNSGVRHKVDNYYGSYETLEDRTNNNGNLTTVSSFTGESFEIRTLDENHKGIPLDLRFYEDNQGNVVVSSFDQDSKYFPGVYFNESGNLAGSNSIIEILSFFRGFRHFVKTFDNPYDKNHLLEIPGIIYEGDWSFNQAKDFVEVLTKSSFIIVPIFPQTTPIFLATGIAWGVLTQVDDLIDSINEETNLNIDKNRKYEFYSIPTLNVVFFLPKILSNSTRNIRDYYRLNQGDWWVYIDSYGREIAVEVDGFKKINENNIPVMKFNAGSESYENYEKFDETFLRVFGGVTYKDQQKIDLIYVPPVNIGDDRLDIGKSYLNSFKEINHDLELELEIKWDGIEDLTLPKGVFNDCWRVREISYSGTITRWFSRGVGQVQTEYQGYKLRLKDYGTGGLPQGTPLCVFDNNLARVLFGVQVR